MGGRGPAPKPNARRRVTGKAPDKIPTTKVASAPLRDPLGPELPKDREWPKQTVEWWDVWRRSEQAGLYMQSDWLYLLDTALIHAAIWTLDPEVLSTRMGLFGELRLRLAKFGATVEDRMRMRVTSSAAPMVAPVAVAAAEPVVGDRRARLLKAVDGKAG
jgi:hypothetical protein